MVFIIDLKEKKRMYFESEFLCKIFSDKKNKIKEGDDLYM